MKLTLFTLFVSTLLSGCTISMEYASIPMDESGWKLGFQTIPKPIGDASYIKEIIPDTDDITNWSKIVTIQYLDTRSNVPPIEFASALITQIRATCPMTEWNVIDSSSRSVTYEWFFTICIPSNGAFIPNIHSAQHEIARVIFGNEGIHKTSYNEKTNNIDPVTRNQWLSIIQDVKLKKDGAIIELQ